jgi:hypothetical protein
MPEGPLTFSRVIAQQKVDAKTIEKDGHLVLRAKHSNVICINKHRMSTYEMVYYLRNPEVKEFVDAKKYQWRSLCIVPNCVSCYNLFTKNLTRVEDFSDFDRLCALQYLQEHTDAKNECKIWNGHSVRGIGIVTFGKINKSASHFAYEVYHKTSLERGIVITSSCGESKCLEEKHLQTNTAKEYAQILKAKGVYNKRTRIHTAKLKELDVIAIRENKEKKSTKELSKEFKVSVGHIREIQQNLSWKDINEKLVLEKKVLSGEEAQKTARKKRKRVTNKDRQVALEVQMARVKEQIIKLKEESFVDEKTGCWTYSKRKRLMFRRKRQLLPKVIYAVYKNQGIALTINDRLYRSCKTDNCLCEAHLQKVEHPKATDILTNTTKELETMNTITLQ